MWEGVSVAAGGVLVGIYAAILLLLCLYGLHRWHLLWLAWRHAGDSQAADVLPDPLPLVTVQLPVFNERYVIARLLGAVSRLDYPHDRLEIQVLDDSVDETTALVARHVARLRASGLRIVHLRRANRAGFKAGALAAGTALACGELIAIFDADFIPPPGFLRAAIPAFSDPGIGMVQARWVHANRRRSLLTRVQAIFLDGHFLVEHLARHRSGRFFNFNGTAGIWRRACIEAAGGWQTETLTEDLDLSYRAQLAGWRFTFLPDLLAPAELPAGMTAFKSQQHRWAKGSVETARKLLGRILTSDFPLAVRLEALFHLTGNCTYVLMTALAVLLWPAIRLREATGAGWVRHADLAVLVLASASVAAFYLHSQRRSGAGWIESLVSIPMLMGFGIGLALNNSRAVIEALARRRSPFVRTPKDGMTDDRSALESSRRTRDTGQAQNVYPCSSGWLPFVEGAFALYLGAALLDVSLRGLWPWIPFLAIFFWGFALTSVLGLGDLRAARRAAPAG